MAESYFKSKVVKPRLEELFVEVEIYVTNVRSMPDWVVLIRDRWIALEFKKHKNADRQANQEYHVIRLNNMGFARFCYPENLEEVLDDIVEYINS